MNLASFLPFLKKKNPFSYFLVLVLRNEKASAVVFEELEGKIRIVGQYTEFFRTSIEDTSDGEILEVLDTAISKAEDSLPENVQTHKTIFGVKETWVENDKIKKEYLARLKKVSDHLELTPIGFLVISQAISHLLQKEEGAPVSAIIVEVGNKSVTVSLIRAGRTMETKTSQIHESVPYTVDALLKHFGASEILPAKIILFDGEKDLTQEFLNHTWSKSLPFLHLPQIATLPLNFDAKAVLVGAATQMGFEILQESPSIQEERPKDTKEAEETESQKRDEELENQKEKLYQEKMYLKPEDFGFTGDVPTLSEKKEEYPPAEEENNKNTKTPSLKTTLLKPESALIVQRTILLLIHNLLKKLKNIKDLASKIQILTKIFKKRFIISAAFVLGLLSLAFLYLFTSQSEIVLTVKPKIIERKEPVVFSTSPISDSEIQNIIGETVTVSEKGSVSTSATGKKQVGEKAIGKVTIFNNHINEVTLVSSTKITSSNDLVFTLDDTIKIASASANPFEGIKPSKKETNVTASSIGQEYNLPTDTTFSINDDALLAAKNDNPFSGGSKKEINIVAKKDIDKLVDQLPKNLEKKAMEKIREQMSKDQVLIPIFISKSLASQSFDKKAGEETDSVTLTGTVMFEIMSYKKDDLEFKVRSFINEDLDKDLVLLDDNLKIQIKDLEEKNKTVTATLNVKALLQPKIDEKDLITNLAGKSHQEAQTLLLKINQVSKANIYSKPHIPLLPKAISRNHKNIKIVIKLDE